MNMTKTKQLLALAIRVGTFLGAVVCNRNLAGVGACDCTGVRAGEDHWNWCWRQCIAGAALVLCWEINLGVKIEPYGEFCLLLGGLFCVIVGEGLSLAVSLSLGG